MQSTNVRQIKAALVDQAFHGTTQVSCLLGPVVAVSRWKGQLRVMIRGWRRWYPVEQVRIERAGAALLQEMIPQRLVGAHPANCCKSDAIRASARQ
jgi:hypothetical protein